MGSIDCYWNFDYSEEQGKSDAMQIEKRYDGDVEMGDVSSSGNSQAYDIGGDRTGHDGDVEMGNVPPPHAPNGASFGSNGFGSGHPPVKQKEEEGNRIRKRVRSSEEVDMEEKGRECERARKWRKSETGWRTCQ